MKTISLIITVVSLAFFASCSSVRVQTDYDKTAPFDTYKTFAFHQKGLKGLDVNDLDKRRIANAITNEMKAKGITPASSEATADVIVNVKATHKKVVDVDTYGSPYWGWGPGWGGWGPDYSVRQYDEGTLVLDIVDRTQNILVWQGSGEGLNVSNIQGKEEAIPKAINEILTKFPPEIK